MSLVVIWLQVQLLLLELVCRRDSEEDCGEIADDSPVIWIMCSIWQACNWIRYCSFDPCHMTSPRVCVSHISNHKQTCLQTNSQDIQYFYNRNFCPSTTLLLMHIKPHYSLKTLESQIFLIITGLSEKAGIWSGTTNVRQILQFCYTKPILSGSIFLPNNFSFSVNILTCTSFLRSFIFI